MKVIERYVKPLLFQHDAVTIRWILATASIFYAAALVSSNIPFTREAYSIMAAVGEQWFWAGAFFAHFAGTYWRMMDPVPRPRPALIINAYGVFIWAFMTISLNVASGYWAPGTALECVMVGLSAWALFRTAKGPERLTP